MTDIWDEMPDPSAFFITIENWDYNQRFDVSAYLNARDAWLEKLKDQWDDLQILSGLLKDTLDLAHIKDIGTVDVIVEWKEKADMWDLALREIKKILENSDFKEKGEDE